MVHFLQPNSKRSSNPLHLLVRKVVGLGANVLSRLTLLKHLSLLTGSSTSSIPAFPSKRSTILAFVSSRSSSHQSPKRQHSNVPVGLVAHVLANAFACTPKEPSRKTLSSRPT